MVHMVVCGVPHMKKAQQENPNYIQKYISTVNRYEKQAHLLLADIKLLFKVSRKVRHGLLLP